MHMLMLTCPHWIQKLHKQKHFRTSSHADVLRLVTRSSPRSWGGTRDKPRNVCVGGYANCFCVSLLRTKIDTTLHA